MFKILYDPYRRIALTHFFIMAAIALNIVLFTESISSAVLQLFLIGFLWLHHIDNLRIQALLVKSRNRYYKDVEQKEQELKAQMNRFEFVVNASRDGFWDYDLVAREFYLSRGWKKRLGFAPDENLTYLSYLSLIPDEYRFEHHNAMHDFIENIKEELEYVHFRIRYPIVTKDGEHLSIEDVGDIFFDKEKNPTRITGFHRDITDQERQNKMLESQNRVAAMGEMIGNIAHQWRQPIAAINNTLNDLEFDIELEDRESITSAEYFAVASKVKEYTAYLSQTIDDFRHISSDEKIKVEYFPQSVVREALGIVESEYQKHAIKSHFSEFGEDGVAYGFERELKQVVINILNNAKDVLVERDIKEPRVMIALYKESTSLTITIHDNAGGIGESVMEKIFDPYFTTKHESVGTGIGLYMSKKIISQYFNGELFVQNRDNGALFTIKIPRNI